MLTKTKGKCNLLLFFSISFFIKRPEKTAEDIPFLLQSYWLKFALFQFLIKQFTCFMFQMRDAKF